MRIYLSTIKQAVYLILLVSFKNGREMFFNTYQTYIRASSGKANGFGISLWEKPIILTICNLRCTFLKIEKWKAFRDLFIYASNWHWNYYFIQMVCEIFRDLLHKMTLIDTINAVSN